MSGWGCDAYPGFIPHPTRENNCGLLPPLFFPASSLRFIGPTSLITTGSPISLVYLRKHPTALPLSFSLPDITLRFFPLPPTNERKAPFILIVSNNRSIRLNLGDSRAAPLSSNCSFQLPEGETRKHTCKKKYRRTIHLRNTLFALVSLFQAK